MHIERNIDRMKTFNEVVKAFRVKDEAKVEVGK